MITQLKEIIAAANPDYIVEFEENKMMNVKADEYALGAKFAYIEEYNQGTYSKEKFFKKKTTQVQIYFCRFIDLAVDASDRELIREQIESEIVLPFMNAYNDSPAFELVNTWRFYTPLPRFDSNEVSIMLQFDCVETMC